MLRKTLFAATKLDSDTWVGEVKHIRGKKLPLTAAGVHGLRDEYTRTIEPARALAAETMKLEPTYPQRPRQPGLRPNPGRNCPAVADCPTPYAHAAGFAHQENARVKCIPGPQVCAGKSHGSLRERTH